MENLFYFLVCVQVLAGLYALRQGLQWLGYVRRRAMADPGFYAPRTAVFCPCKGMERGLEQNLVALTEFHHQNYEIFFILASASDPAYNTVKRVAEQSRVKAHVLIAGKPENCGEKVNNLRFAVEQLPEEFDMLVFVDSDGRPGKSWLQRLTAPLADDRIGATTTMRWLIPLRANLATLLLSVWNAPIVTMLSEKGKNFCWGGGTAIRRHVFEHCDIIEYWRNSVSDDYSMTEALQRGSRTIFFVPECLTLSFVETTFTGLWEFTNRQISITRVYSRKMWMAGAVTHLWYCLTLLFGMALIVETLIATLPVIHLVMLTFLPILLAAMRSALRLAAVTEALPSAKSQVMSHVLLHIALSVVIPFWYVANFAHSLVTRKIRWRGITYELFSPEQTHIVSS